jgi:hypothetical protein
MNHMLQICPYCIRRLLGCFKSIHPVKNDGARAKPIPDCPQMLVLLPDCEHTAWGATGLVLRMMV